VLFLVAAHDLLANPGGYTGTPWFEVEDGDRFFGLHLK
jgi:hypothetical protein